nr:hypothetical protein [Bifidobacterium longum]
MRHDLNDYVWWSDNQRLHSTPGCRSPKVYFVKSVFRV